MKGVSFLLFLNDHSGRLFAGDLSYGLVEVWIKRLICGGNRGHALFFEGRLELLRHHFNAA